MIRQSVLLLAIVLCSTASALMPGCRTRYEMRLKWAVENVPSAYWECPRWGHAVNKSCPSGTLFSAPYQTCVPEKHWEPFPYYAPPTTPNDYEDECKEVDECVNPCLSIECNEGKVVGNQCVCPEGAELDNGTCKFKPSIDECGENGHWDVMENRCLCNDGYEFLNGWCFKTSGKCVGAPESAYSRGTMDCEPLECTKEQYTRGTLYPTRNPRSFFQCANVNWLIEMPCAVGTCFDFKEQVCIHARDWVNQCA